MKKIITKLILILSLTFALYGCEDGLDVPYDINNTITITNVQIKDLKLNGNYHITFTKDDKDYKFQIEPWLVNDIEKLIASTKMLDKDKWLYFDIVIDDKQLVSVANSNNKN